MTRRIRLGEFPGGVLEINAYDDDPTDGQPGVYLESRHADHSAQRGAEIQYRPAAIGHLRTDVSGIARFHDESQIRTLATRLGYDFADMIVYDPKFGRPPLARPTPATKAPASASTPPIKCPPNSTLAIDNRAYNSLLRGVRALGERGFALLTQRWRILQHITASCSTSPSAPDASAT